MKITKDNRFVGRKTRNPNIREAGGKGLVFWLIFTILYIQFDLFLEPLYAGRYFGSTFSTKNSCLKALGGRKS